MAKYYENPGHKIFHQFQKKSKGVSLMPKMAKNIFFQILTRVIFQSIKLIETNRMKSILSLFGSKYRQYGGYLSKKGTYVFIFHEILGPARKYYRLLTRFTLDVKAFHLSYRV